MALRMRTFKPAMAMAARSARGFHTTRPAFVKAGEAVPNLEVLVENSPGNKVNLASEFSLKDGIVIGVPAAFSPGCSSSHIPSYMNHPKIKDAGQVFVVSVNDAFVLGPSRWTLPVRPGSGSSATHRRPSPRRWSLTLTGLPFSAALGANAMLSLSRMARSSRRTLSPTALEPTFPWQTRFSVKGAGAGQRCWMALPCSSGICFDNADQAGG
ncbi:hypothetical protein RB597_001092 [Gaeumannomyces tritici]